MTPAIMVLRSDRLGDLVLTSGYLAGLAEQLAGKRIDLWVAPDMDSIAQIIHPGVNVLPLPFDRFLECTDDTLRAWVEQISTEYQELIVPQFTLGFPEIVALAYSSIPQRYGFRNAELPVLPDWVFARLGAPTVPIGKWILSGPDVETYSSEVSKYAALAASHIPGGFSVGPRVYSEPRSNSPQGVLVWPGSGAEVRRWPIARFVEVVLGLKAERIVIGGTEPERELVCELHRLLAARGAHSDVRLCDASNLGETASWIQSFEMVLTNDTGIAHLAAALGCRTVAVSPSQFQGRFVLRGKSALTIFADVPCARCDGLCLFEDSLWPCVDAVNASDVLEAIRNSPGGERAIFLPAPRLEIARAVLPEIQAAAHSRLYQWDHERFEISAALARLRHVLAETESQRERFQKLFTEAVGQRDELRVLLESAEEQRNRLQQFFTDAAAHRDTLRALLVSAEQQRDDARALLGEAAQEHERLHARFLVTEQKVEEYYRVFPWCRDLSLATTAAALPKISVVTPSFQQADFLDHTIRSVLEQEYANFEHIVVDGGSSDGTVNVLKRYPHVHWVSESDHGQAHAINKGLLMASGDILAYLNSDDVYLPGAFHAVAEYFRNHPDARVLVGHCDCIDEAGKLIGHYDARLGNLEDLICYWNWGRTFCIPQPSVFYRRDLLAETGLFDIRLQMALDYEMWLRMTTHTRFQVCDRTLAAFRMATNTKTISRTHEMFVEELEVSRRYWRHMPPRQRMRVAVKAHRHAANRLLNSAEHFAFAPGKQAPVRRILGMSAQAWPALAMTPRFLFTAMQALATNSGVLLAAVQKVHRSYLGLKWHALQRWKGIAG